MISYYVLDTETTGLKCGWHEINAISVINVETKEEIYFDIKVEFPQRASPQALEVQSKKIDDLLQGIPLKEAVIKINEWISADGKKNNSRCIVAHNAPFDRKFCYSAWTSVGEYFPADLWICTKQFGQRYVKKYGGEKIAKAQCSPKPKFGLTTFMQGVGLPIKTGAHNALVDCINTVELFNWLMNSKTEYVSLIEKIPHKEPETAQEIYEDY